MHAGGRGLFCRGVEVSVAQARAAILARVSLRGHDGEDKACNVRTMWVDIKER